jgi:long-chain acyl-CoA synthetase
LFGLTKKGGFRVNLSSGDIWFKELITRHKPSERPKLDIGPEDVAIFQYSGGTTGISKGAIGLHKNLVANALQIRSWITNAIDGEETVLMAIPLFHVYGIAGMLLP